jgi:hypothetical protein
MEMPETYRAKAKQYLRDAENSSGIMRIHFILLAQRWFELADFFTPYWGSDVEHEAKQSGKSDILGANARTGEKKLPVSPIGRS